MRLARVAEKQDEYCKGGSLCGAGFQPAKSSVGAIASATSLAGLKSAPPIPATFPRIGLTAGHKPATDGIEGISSKPTSGFQNSASETSSPHPSRQRATE